MCPRIWCWDVRCLWRKRSLNKDETAAVVILMTWTKSWLKKKIGSATRAARRSLQRFRNVDESHPPPPQTALSCSYSCPPPTTTTTTTAITVHSILQFRHIFALVGRAAGAHDKPTSLFSERLSQKKTNVLMCVENEWNISGAVLKQLRTTSSVRHIRKLILKQQVEGSEPRCQTGAAAVVIFRHLGLKDAPAEERQQQDSQIQIRSLKQIKTQQYKCCLKHTDLTLINTQVSQETFYILITVTLGASSSLLLITALFFYILVRDLLIFDSIPVHPLPLFITSLSTSCTWFCCQLAQFFLLFVFVLVSHRLWAVVWATLP